MLIQVSGRHLSDFTHSSLGVTSFPIYAITFPKSRKWRLSVKSVESSAAENDLMIVHRHSITEEL